MNWFVRLLSLSSLLLLLASCSDSRSSPQSPHQPPAQASGSQPPLRQEPPGPGSRPGVAGNRASDDRVSGSGAAVKRPGSAGSEPRSRKAGSPPQGSRQDSQRGSPVPRPLTLLLAGAGLILLAYSRRRHQVAKPRPQQLKPRSEP